MLRFNLISILSATISKSLEAKRLAVFNAVLVRLNKKEAAYTSSYSGAT